jgi:hypothetical protein
MDQIVYKLGRASASFGVVVVILILAAIATPRWTVIDSDDIYMGLVGLLAIEQLLGCRTIAGTLKNSCLFSNHPFVEPWHAVVEDLR